MTYLIFFEMNFKIVVSQAYLKLKLSDASALGFEMQVVKRALN
jgi:hypothetical protein